LVLNIAEKQSKKQLIRLARSEFLVKLICKPLVNIKTALGNKLIANIIDNHLFIGGANE